MHREFVKQTRWVQLRRETCACGEDYVYLAQGAVHAKAKGMKWLSVFQSGEALVRKVDEQLRKQLRAVESSKRAGRARCPHCGRYRWWMWWPPGTFKNTGMGFFGATPLAALVLGLLGKGLPAGVAWPLFGSVCLLGAAVGYAYSIRGGTPHGVGDPASLTLDEHEQLVATARGQGEEPALLLAKRVGPKDGKLLRGLQSLNAGVFDAEGVEVLAARVAPGGGFE